MTKTRTLTLTALATLWPALSNAAITFRTGTLAAVQVDSHERLGREDVAWLNLPGAWSGVTCPSDWVWFNAKTSPQLLATALAARTTGAEVKIYVDDGLAKTDGYCQAIVVVL